VRGIVCCVHLFGYSQHISHEESRQQVAKKIVFIKVGWTQDHVKV
jgi:hypothetical protein